MGTIPANLSRAPTLLSSQLFSSRLTRTNLDLVRLQEQISTAKAVNKPSDDAIKAAGIALLDDKLERADQRKRNLATAESSLSLLDTTIGDANDLVLEAITLASSQIGANSDADTRKTQAVVVDSMIRQLYELANRESNGLYLFGGSTATRPPIEETSNGFRYTAKGNGLFTDIDLGDEIPVTIGGQNAIGETSARHKSTNDLNPRLTTDTRLTNINGSRGQGINLSPFQFSFDGGPTQTVDLTDVDTIDDVITQLTSAINDYETTNAVTILGPGGISPNGGSLSFDIVAGAPDPQLTFSDIGTGKAAEDLGLSAAPFENTNAAGADLNPKLTLHSRVSTLPGLTPPLDSIRIKLDRNGNTQSTIVDLSSATTINDIKNLIEGNVKGVRVQINNAGTGLNVYNEISGKRLSIEEVAGGSNTATELGIRTLNQNTPIDHFNDGRGVGIVTDRPDPVTGTVTRQYNTDFRVTLDSGQYFEVDLRPQDLTDVLTLGIRINQEFTNAVAAAPLNSSAPALASGDFSVGLTDDANGITFFDNTSAGSPPSITQLNNSPAANDLGLLDATWDAANNAFIAQDRATVRVDSLFSTLMDLADALRNNDSDGITVAGSELEEHVGRIASTQALVGVFGNRVLDATQRLEDTSLQDEKTRSLLQDLDFGKAALEFNLLQTQLQATIQSGLPNQPTLLDFLG